MKMLVIAHDIPYPPTHGGRVDMWRRLNLLHKNGAEIFLVTWSYQTVDEDSRRALASICSKFYVLPIRKTWKHRLPRLKYLATLPLYEAIRAVRPNCWRDIRDSLEEFLPTIIWLDGLYGGTLALELSDHLKIPIYYRTHNIEHRYMQILSEEASTNRARLAAWIGCWRLLSFEEKIMNSSVHIFDVSIDDASFWFSKGYRKVTYLPPIAPLISNNYDIIKPTYDIVFLGNLHVANNKSGVKWLLEEIMPEVWRNRPATTLLVAGSNPSEQLARLGEKDNRITLVADPDDAIETLLMGYVLINPVRKGSGVSIKTIDMLATGRPFVSTPQGIMGLHPKTRKYIHVGNDTVELASLLVRLRENIGKDDNTQFHSMDPYTSSYVVEQLKKYIPELTLSS
ncbi:MAG: glycosyltransferase [Acidithiobacillus sp.]|nr:glycosyltransferase [Acidithiobacillus sp.]